MAGLALDVHAVWLFLGGIAVGAVCVLMAERLAGLLRWARRRLERGSSPGGFRVW